MVTTVLHLVTVNIVSALENGFCLSCNMFLQKLNILFLVYFLYHKKHYIYIYTTNILYNVSTSTCFKASASLSSSWIFKTIFYVSFIHSDEFSDTQLLVFHVICLSVWCLHSKTFNFYSSKEVTASHFLSFPILFC